MLTFSKISYGNNDQTLLELKYKTKADYINEGYNIIPFYYNSCNLAGFVFTKGTEITIAYHGTQNLNDMATDVNVLFIAPSFLHNRGRMHRGFYKAFIDSYESLYYVLENHSKEQKKEIKELEINFTGHSMGAAIAQIAALSFSKTEQATNLHVAW